MVKLLIQNLSLGDKHICIQMNTISCLFGMQIQKHQLQEELLELNGLKNSPGRVQKPRRRLRNPELQLRYQMAAALDHPNGLCGGLRLTFPLISFTPGNNRRGESSSKHKMQLMRLCNGEDVHPKGGTRLKHSQGPWNHFTV